MHFATHPVLNITFSLEKGEKSPYFPCAEGEIVVDCNAMKSGKGELQKLNRVILFDLDGTLTDSREGIVNSVRYALEKMGLPIPPEETLLRFIGPPLEDSFHEFCGLEGEQVQEAVRTYRERYNPIGVYENLPAPGLAGYCRKWKAEGFRLALASSKPEHLCEKVCQRFGFAESMEVIAGSQPGAGMTKADVIRACMQRMHLTEEDKAHTLMVGDRKFDVEGAAECGLPCVGVEFFGYAEPGELEAAGAVAVVQTAAELDEYLHR